MKYFQPLQFGLLSLLFYVLLYYPQLDSHSEDFVTILMVFFTAIGWCGMILLTKNNQNRALLIYIILSIIGPILLYLFVDGFHHVLHGITFAISLVILVALKIFTASYMKQHVN